VSRVACAAHGSSVRALAALLPSVPAERGHSDGGDHASPRRKRRVSSDVAGAPAGDLQAAMAAVAISGVRLCSRWHAVCGYKYAVAPRGGDNLKDTCHMKVQGRRAALTAPLRVGVQTRVRRCC
jgi:hypothetical protein